MPVALAASQLYSNWLGFSANIWQAEEYISFVSKFILGMGLGFEMPVIILVLVKIGILNYRILAKGRRYMIIVNLILGAVLTTPEVLTQILMAVPLQVLYEITVWVAWCHSTLTHLFAFISNLGNVPAGTRHVARASAKFAWNFFSANATSASVRRNRDAARCARSTPPAPAPC